MFLRQYYWKLRTRRYPFVFIVFILTCILYFYNFYTTNSLDTVPSYKSKCNFEFAKHLIENMCSLNKENKDMIVGNICSDICDPKNLYEFYKNYRLSDCYVKPQDKDRQFFTESKSVLIYELQDKTENSDQNQPKKLVFKSSNKYYLDFDTHLDYDFRQKTILEQLEYLQNFIDSTLYTKFDIQIDKKYFQTWSNQYTKDPIDAVEQIKKSIQENNLNYYVKLFDTDNFDYYLDALKNSNKEKLSSFIQSFIILTSQDEYLFYRFYQKKPGALRIYGSCGHFYMVEYAQPLTYKVRFMNNINERKILALQFLDLFHNLDRTYLLHKNNNNSLQSQPVQMCDVKLDNFGLNHNGELRIIDTDMASSDSYLFSSRVCRTHDDCHFFDCKSFCDLESKRCIKKRINNNLQVLCEKIFDNNLNKKDGILTGVNFESNIHNEIMNKLDKCKRPGFYKNSDVPKLASDRLFRAFNVLLRDNGIKLENKQ
ncbi:unnamed protein product [Brachionus calyciflorus]|uniref:FAM69 protein-kinase domain-containing protein n=1 Tax=Brachionus calyciflorus TaxID=104777 RepID=A0A813MZB3_9BILA|nr:unnamed protein product [Brachionus calyciflorus]